MTNRARALWAFAVTSIALFMAALDNLVVTTALPVIKRDPGASLSSLEWTVNAYTLTFAVLLLTGAALGDRFGRKRMFALGLAVFTLGSAAAALAPSVGSLIAARAVQGLGGAFVMPLSLTILSSAVAPQRRGLALGAWGGVSGLAVAAGPLVGGADVQGISRRWIFWLNVPSGWPYCRWRSPAWLRRPARTTRSTFRGSALPARDCSAWCSAWCVAASTAGPAWALLAP
jgi:MFS family permease